MKTKAGFFLKVLSLCLAVILFLSGAQAEEQLLTVAESSDFKATSTYNQVMDFIRALQGETAMLKAETLCVSSEGRKVPLMIIGNPLPSSPMDLRRDDRAVIYIQANIHAGEVEGKEACLMLARDILRQDPSPYLDDLVILICPIFNADGNERIDPQNRRNQVGPEQGVGIRYNGQNLDLNRDGLKMESPEVSGLAANVLNRWDPLLLVDCHTTNGSYHTEPVTYVWSLDPNGDQTLIRYMADKMMPATDKILEEKYGTLAIPYGNWMDFSNPEKGWRPAGPEPRYLTNYIGLRSRLSILIENYAYADYKTRVMGNYHFLKSILDYSAAHREEIKDLIRQADRRTITKGTNPSGSIFGITFEGKALKEPVTIQSWEMKVTPREGGGRPRVQRTDIRKDYTVPYFADYIPTRSVAFPYGYLITVPDKDVARKLMQHGIVVETLVEPVTAEVENFTIKKLEGAQRIYQGHRQNTIEGEYGTITREFPAGTLYVGTSQILGNLAAALLEPESSDGLLVWNYFDKYIASQWGRSVQDCPVYRILKPVKVVTHILR
jgi:dipeptidyl-peptidase-4